MNAACFKRDLVAGLTQLSRATRLPVLGSSRNVRLVAGNADLALICAGVTIRVDAVVSIPRTAQCSL